MTNTISKGMLKYKSKGSIPLWIVDQMLYLRYPSIMKYI